MFWRHRGNLQIAVICPNPDERFVLRRFADRVDGGVHFRRGIVDRYST
jgi:hypothetical protein